MRYVDGFVLAVPKKNIPAYKKMAQQASKIWIELGALDFHETVGDDLEGNMGLPFPRLVKLKPGETVVFSWITYKSRAHRDKVNVKVMADPRIAKMMEGKKPPFDVKRMSYGGFNVLVEA